MTRRILLILLFNLHCLAISQVPMLPPEFLDHARQVQGDRVRFCVLQDSVLSKLNESVARLLADALLLDATIYEVSLPHHVQPLGYRIPLTSEELFFLLNNECDAFMGYLLSTGTHAEWQITTAPYLRTGFVLTSRITDAHQALKDLGAGTRVGTQLGSAPNSRLTMMLRNQSDPTLRRIPYPDNRILMERLVDGSVDVALVWEPAVWAFNSAALYVSHDLRPLPDMAASFAITLLSSNAFLQTTLDAAIRAVSEDGSLAALIEQSGIPGEVP